MAGGSTATLLTTMMVTQGIGKGISSIGQGYASAAESKYNDTIAGLKVQALQVKNQIEQGQYTRQAGELLSKQTATAGAAGIEPTGSVAASMLDSQTQINTDMAIAQFNNQLQQNFTASEISGEGQQDIMAGYTNAFSDILSGGSQAALWNYGPYKKMLRM